MPAAHPPVRGILLDIEGTTSSISFVYDVMFPFVRRELAAYLAAHEHDANFLAARAQIAADAGHASFAEWAHCAGVHDAAGQRQLVSDEVTRLMDGDVKAGGLKLLQGLVWEAGFASGELQAHVYDDVPRALERWNGAGIDVRIYSSGSVQAQKLFFGHTVAGDLLGLLRGHYDTSTGPKREATSYRRIAKEFKLPADQVLFISDVVPELDAASAAGLQTALAVRPGNAPQPADHGHRIIGSFDELTL
jgi:enolase-phosphatase E1